MNSWPGCLFVSAGIPMQTAAYGGEQQEWLFSEVLHTIRVLYLKPDYNRSLAPTDDRYPRQETETAARGAPLRPGWRHGALCVGADARTARPRSRGRSVVRSVSRRKTARYRGSRAGHDSAASALVIAVALRQAGGTLAGSKSTPGLA